MRRLKIKVLKMPGVLVRAEVTQRPEHFYDVSEAVSVVHDVLPADAWLHLGALVAPHDPQKFATAVDRLNALLGRPERARIYYEWLEPIVVSELTPQDTLRSLAAILYNGIPFRQYERLIAYLETAMDMDLKEQIESWADSLTTEGP